MRETPLLNHALNEPTAFCPEDLEQFTFFRSDFRYE